LPQPFLVSLRRSISSAICTTKVRTRLVLAFAYVLITVIVALTVPLAVNQRERAESDLLGQAKVTAQAIAASFDEASLAPASRDRLARQAERDAEESTGVAVRALGLGPGQVVADIGAGSGYYTVRMAREVGPTGKVYATDVQPGMLRLLVRRLDQAGLTNVVPVLGAVDDPKLPEEALDLALMVDVYHELSRPQEVLRNLRTALKPDGRLVLIEFRKESSWVPIREEHKMSVKEARIELEAEGYRFDGVIDILPWQHILVFKP